MSAEKKLSNAQLLRRRPGENRRAKRDREERELLERGWYLQAGAWHHPRKAQDVTQSRAYIIEFGDPDA